MAARIQDVAVAAGVSITTVSHVLSGQGRVAESTRKRVAQAVADLGYRANIHAQQLVTQRSRTLAIQMSSSSGPSDQCAVIPNSDYFLEVLNGASEAAAARSYALILIPPDADLTTLSAFAIDGAILVDPRGDESFFTGGWDYQHRLVTTGRPIARRRRVPVVVDNDLVASASLMMTHLAESGYERPALITTDTSRSYTSDLLAGYTAWAEANAVEPVVVAVDEPPTREGAAAALGQLLDRRTPPDAIFASSENLALGALQEAQKRGVRVPEDLGVCSAVDSGLLQLTSPQVTGMFVYPREVGRQAASVLMDLVEGERPVRKVEVPVQLNARASTQR